LAACSKNAPENAVEGFSHPDMVLKLEDFSAIKANWEEKPNNLREIATGLNIGLDSLVFVDDNPVEQELVRAQLPRIAVPHVSEEVSRFARYLEREGLFESVRVSRDDAQRASYYAVDEKRALDAAKFADYGEFLRSLDMKAEIGKFNTLYLDRICQLTN